MRVSVIVRPACRSTNLSLPRPFSSGDRFIQPCIFRASAGFAESRMGLLATSGLDLPSKIRSIRSGRNRSILPWASSSCRVADASGTAAWAPRQQIWRATSVVSSPRVTRQSPARSSRAHPLLGLRRPSCADVTGISSGCIHLHGAVSAWLRRRRPFSVL